MTSFASIEWRFSSLSTELELNVWPTYLKYRQRHSKELGEMESESDKNVFIY